MFDLPINSMVMFHSFWYVLKISSRWDPPYGSPVPVPVISIVNPQRGVSVTASGSKRSGEYGSIGSNTIGFWIIPQYIGEYNPQLIWLVVFRPSEKWWSSSVGMMIIPNIWKVIKAMFQTTSQWCYELSFMSFLCWKNAIDLISGFVRENWISEHVAIQITHLSFRNRGWILSRSLMSVSKVFRLSKRWNSPVRQNSRITEAKPFTSYAYRWWYFYGLSFHKWGDLLTSSWLVVYLPLRKIWVRQLGLMTFPIYIYIYIYMESHKSHVPNHQPVMLWTEFHVISMLEKCNRPYQWFCAWKLNQWTCRYSDHSPFLSESRVNTIQKFDVSIQSVQAFKTLKLTGSTKFQNYRGKALYQLCL